MKSIKFGTDGWRAMIAEDYTVSNVRRIASGTAIWMKQKGMASAVIGHDCRFGGRMFLEETAKTLAAHGIVVLAAQGFVSTPMVSLGVIRHAAGLGVVITASHNPPSYNGFKLKSSYGGPTIPSDIAEVESLIPDDFVLPEVSYETYCQQGLISHVDLEAEYLDHVARHFDLSRLQAFRGIAYDAMYGAGQRIMQQILPQLKAFHCEYNPGFGHTPPEPITRNLSEIMQFLAAHPGQSIGIANDGDADRIAMMDDRGRMVDSHHILLLLVQYLHVHKKMSGKIVVSFSVTNKLKKLADHYGLETIVTKIGFKYIAEYMICEDVLVAGEESGGLAIKDIFRARRRMDRTHHSRIYSRHRQDAPATFIDEVYDIVGAFSYDRHDLHLTASDKDKVQHRLSQQRIASFGPYEVRNYENLDGDKYYLDNDAWIMYRLSGTEPVLRIYAQGQHEEEVNNLLQCARAAVMG
ncbi:MAG: phosphoglucomutase/phosphomannomutase family protein [Saprospiraceae bacterium]